MFQFNGVTQDGRDHESAPAMVDPATTANGTATRTTGVHGAILVLELKRARTPLTADPSLGHRPARLSDEIARKLHACERRVFIGHRAQLAAFA